jgi:hypothetical protein
MQNKDVGTRQVTKYDQAKITLKGCYETQTNAITVLDPTKDRELQNTHRPEQ